MDRLRHLMREHAGGGWLAVGVALFACAERSPPTAENRFAAVRSSAPVKAEARFCDRVYPGNGPDARTWSPPKERPLAGAPDGPSLTAGSFKWINLWATWCEPCLTEMPLLERWRGALASDGVRLGFELWTVDEDESRLRAVLAKELRGRIPGRVHWVESAEDLAGILANLGVDRNSALPIHAIVDPDGHLRCVRVGAVGEDTYGTVKSMLTKG